MAYLPSHQELASHPKTRKAARRLGVTLPTMIGHLHLLWWWALDHAPDGNLGKYDAEDLADAALWDDDPETFVKALRDCGSAGGDGFLHDDGQLHDWDDYGGKYGKRVQAARKAAAARWQSHEDADAIRTHSEGNANASDPHCDTDAAGNAEERRGEDRKNLSSAPADPKVSEDARELTRTFAVAVRANGFSVPKREQKAYADWLTDMDRLIRLGAPGGDADPQDPDEVRRVIEFATSDGFWKANIGSPSKFREQYPKLRLRMLNDAPQDDGEFVGGVRRVQ